MRVFQALQLLQYLGPIYFQILVNKDVAETGIRSETMCKVDGKHFRLSQRFYRSVGITRFFQTFHSDYPVSDIDARLGCNLEISLHDEVGIGLEFIPRLCP